VVARVLGTGFQSHGPREFPVVRAGVRHASSTDSFAPQLPWRLLWHRGLHSAHILLVLRPLLLGQVRLAPGWGLDSSDESCISIRASRMIHDRLASSIITSTFR
jgi:hypothetical protein